MRDTASSPKRINRGLEKKMKLDDEWDNDQMSKNSVLNKTLNETFRKPFVGLSNTCEETKRRTGFLSEDHLLFCAVMVCNGDLELMLQSNFTLTWLKE